VLGLQEGVVLGLQEDVVLWNEWVAVLLSPLGGGERGVVW